MSRPSSSADRPVEYAHGFRVGDRVKVLAGAAFGKYGTVIRCLPGAVDVLVDDHMLPMQYRNPVENLDLIEREVRA